MSQQTQQVSSYNLREIDRLTTDIQNSVIRHTKQVLKDTDKNFTGNLSDSIVPGENNSQGFKTVVVTSKYGVPVEFGMPPGIHVNFDELRKWVEGKLGIDPSESKDVTFKIWKKILDKGIPQTRFFKKGIKLTIAAHGVLNLSTPRQKRSKFVKNMNKFSRGVKKVTKYINKFNKVRKKLK